MRDNQADEVHPRERKSFFAQLSFATLASLFPPRMSAKLPGERAGVLSSAALWLVSAVCSVRSPFAFWTDLFARIRSRGDAR